jgi:hypothetical protein
VPNDLSEILRTADIKAIYVNGKIYELQKSAKCIESTLARFEEALKVKKSVYIIKRLKPKLC